MVNVGTNLNSSKEFTRPYHKILACDYPTFLDDYINTSAMQRIGQISISCGCNYTNLFDLKFLYTNLDHSIGVALIIWNFTKDKKQTLSGLFHDIATPTFKHCIDFMNGDHENQESTEELTITLIQNSKEIMDLLKRDNIQLEEVADYKLYPIADNNLPQLSADRLEYTLSSGVIWPGILDIDDIMVVYNDLVIVKNESHSDELAFNTVDIAEFFVEKINVLWYLWFDNRNKVAGQFIAETISLMKDCGFLEIEDLYRLSEMKVVEKFLCCPDRRISDAFTKFVNLTEAYDSNVPVYGKYCKSVRTKRRYINPLVKTPNGCKRISEVSLKAKKHINDYLNFETPQYVYLDIDT